VEESGALRWDCNLKNLENFKEKKEFKRKEKKENSEICHDSNPIYLKEGIL